MLNTAGNTVNIENQCPVQTVLVIHAKATVNNYLQNTDLNIHSVLLAMTLKRCNLVNLMSL